MNTFLKLTEGHHLEPSPHLRGIAILTVAAVLGAFIWMMAVAANDIRIFLIVGFVVVAFWGVERCSKECSIIRRYAISIGRVKKFSKAAGSEGGSYYEVTYEFSAANGDVYEGSSGRTSKELPEQGGLIEVLYARENPATSMPREVFWFYGW